ncbi:MAG TPA: UPF0182 family protein, partial [Longimicrobiaceae bacterium]|nr:UPF0182 family protein [Longimicrobiaceae bacterium]
RRYANIEIAERLPQTYVVTAVGLVSIFSAWWLSAGVADPLPVLAAIDPAPWGLADPVFGRDVSFYVFQWPVLNRLQTLAALLVFWIVLLAVAAYVATGAIKLAESKPSLSPLARRHLGLLAAAFLFLYAINIWLDRYGIVVDGAGFANALGYTDVHARLPAKLAVFVIALLASAAVGYGTWIGDLRAAALAGALMIVALIGGEALYPSGVQRFVVEPNEFPREQAFIERHLEFTRHAYGLADIGRAPLPYQARRDLQEDRLIEQIERIPLWDPRPLLTTYRQQQGLFRYYTFASVHHDRYGDGDDVEPVAISVRELETSELEDAAQTWQNLHLNYVSSEGVVVSPVSRMASDGTPIFYVWDLDPPKTAPEAPAGLALTEPDIFFSERTRDYIIVDADARPIGVAIDAAWKKLLFAWSFQCPNILLSGDLTRESKIVYRRRVAERVREVAPFLRVSEDRSVYPVIHEGRVVWVVDAYTTASTFPLAPLVGFENRGVRYIRNSVKATVDGVTGQVRLYAVDPVDPILATYSRIFPGLVRPLEEMPPSLQGHLRYPVQMMYLQAQVLGAYHLLDPRAFYEQEDVWTVATELYRGTPALMEPTYTMYRLPDSEQVEFLLTVPFVPRGRQNMTGLFVTRNDPPHYGEKILYLLPRDALVPGPQQIEAMIDQNPDISQQLSLWRRGGSDVLRGHMMIVPIDSTLIYLEPLFLEAENAAIPQLERVILARSGDVVMQPSFEAAVAALLRGQAAVAQLAASADEGENGGTDPTADPAAIARARRLLDEAETLLRSGDWAGFGRTWEALRQVLTTSAGPS